MIDRRSPKNAAVRGLNVLYLLMLPQSFGGMVRLMFISCLCTVLGWNFPYILAFPTFALLLPALIIWGCHKGGMLTAILAYVALSIGVYYSTPPWTYGLVTLIVMPAIVFRIVALYYGSRFHFSFAITWAGCFILLLGGGLLAFRLVWIRLYESPITYALKSLEYWLNSSKDAGAALLEAYRYGLARLENQPFALQFGSNIWIAPSQSKELIDSLIATLTTLAQSYIPSSFVSASVIGATLCAVCPPDDSPSIAPKFSQWRMPIRGTAGIFMSVALALFVLNLISGGAFAVASGLAVTVVQTALMICGASVIEHRFESRGMAVGLRRTIIALCFIILGIVCTILGLVDSLFNLRRLSPPGTDDDSDETTRLL